MQVEAFSVGRGNDGDRVQQHSYLGDDDLRESIRQLLFVLVVVAMVVLVYLTNKGSTAFPLLDPEPSAAFVIAGIAAVLSFAGIARIRSKVVPWGKEARHLTWITVAALAYCAGGLSWVLVDLANRRLDRAPPHEVRYTILGKYSFRGDYFVRAAPESRVDQLDTESYSIGVSEKDWNSAHPGSVLLLDLRPGFLGFRWIARHSVCDTTEISC